MQQKKKTVDSDSGSTCSFICKYIIYIFRILRTITHTIFAGHENEHVTCSLANNSFKIIP